MNEGRFIQLGPTPNGTANEGYGSFVTVEHLETLERQRVKEQLDKLRPELLADGAKAVRAKLEAEQAVEQLRKTLHSIVGGDGVRVAMAMITDEAKRPMPKAPAQVATKK